LFTHTPTLTGERVILRPVTVDDVREGVRRDALRWDGERVDAITMSILARLARSSPT
jgi:hypothetical protein